MKVHIILSVVVIVAADIYIPPYTPTTTDEVCSLLNWSVLKKHECLIAMINKGHPGVWANPTKCSNANTTPLHVVTESDNADVVRLLLAMGAAIDAKDSMGRTPLHYAVNSTESGTVTMELLFAGANVNVADDNGDTPLHFAVRQYVHIEHRDDYYYSSSRDSRRRLWKRIVLLLAAGANRGAVNSDRETAMSIALEMEEEKLPLLLLGHATLQVSPSDGLCAEHTAIQRNEQDEFGVNAVVNDTDWCGRNSLHVAAINGQSSIGTLTNRTDVNAKDVCSRTALHEASRRGNLPLVREMLAARASVDAADWLGLTPLHLASLCGHDDVKELLLIARADSESRDKLGRTPHDLAEGVVFRPPSSPSEPKGDEPSVSTPPPVVTSD